MALLIFCNKFNFGSKFLTRVKEYFSRKACLHFIGNTLGKEICKKIGAFIVCTPIASIPAAGGYVVEKEHQTGTYAINQMHQFLDKNPTATKEQAYKVYNVSYYNHANSNLIGRKLYDLGVMKPTEFNKLQYNYNIK
jgi:hypothetical protein